MTAVLVKATKVGGHVETVGPFGGVVPAEQCMIQLAVTGRYETVTTEPAPETKP